jgi:hypothetical protein
MVARRAWIKSTAHRQRARLQSYAKKCFAQGHGFSRAESSLRIGEEDVEPAISEESVPQPLKPGEPWVTMSSILFVFCARNYFLYFSTQKSFVKSPILSSLLIIKDIWFAI